LSKGWPFGKLLTWIWLLVLTLSLNDLNAKSLYISICFQPDSLKLADTLNVGDTIVPDTSNIIKTVNDSIKPNTKEHNIIEDKVSRNARDSIVQRLSSRKVYLYGDAEVTYQDIKLKAAFIEVDFNTNTLFAHGVEDSTGKLIGVPEFTEGDQTFKAKQMSYNFDTQKGIIYKVITEDDQGFLHGKKVKKEEDNTINVLNGSYTTCNLEENPHFAFKFKKARMIPDNKIVTGPAYMEIEGVPTVLALPFAIFPNKSGQKSGIVIPTYGESPTRGFFLENGGYYWAINDYMDLQVLGDIYSRGSWAIKPRFRYRKRYKYNGSFELGYGQNVVGVKEAPDYSKTKDFRIRWTHSQDPKARPRSSFSANVNIVTSNYVKYNVVSTEDYLSNEFQSSVAYQTNWAGKYFLTANTSFRQNTKTHQVNISLPELTFTVNRFYPLRKEGGKKRFYEDLSISYSMNAKNSVSTLDSLIFEPGNITKNMQNGIVHKIPISLPAKVLKYFTLSNSINTTDRMYSQSVKQFYRQDTAFVDSDTLLPGLITDTINGFYNTIDFSLSSSLTTKIYGMLRFKKGPLRAIRHVLTPSVGISYRPDFSTDFWGYYDTYLDADSNEVKYSKYNNSQYTSVYGTPPANNSGAITFSLSNNLEIKVPSKKDTITGLKKIKLIDNLTISGNYDLAKDSLNMSYLSVNGRSTIWKNISIQYSSLWDPYVLNDNGQRINRWVWDEYHTLFRWVNTSWNLSLNLKLGDKDFGKKKEKPKEATETEWENIQENPDDFVDWSIPWSVNISYKFQYLTKELYVNNVRNVDNKIVQSLGLNGQINITPKWKLTLRADWDFTANELAYASVNIYRDLHCWEMRFNWIPIGSRKSWNFSINVKASILQDLKLNRKKDFRDI